MKIKFILSLVLSLSFVQVMNAAPTEAEALAAVKKNIKEYFENSYGRCFVIEDMTTSSTPVLNKWAKKIIAFYDKAVAANFNIEKSEVLNPTQEVLEALEAEGRQLEYEVLGKVGHHWFKNSVYQDLGLEEIAEEQSVLSCSLEIKKAMALVAPALTPKDANGDLLPEAFFQLTHNGVVQERERPTATAYAAMAVDYWFGEAGIEEILSVNGTRAENVAGFFKDVWQTGIVRALRYKKENASYGLSWYKGNVSRAESDFDIAVEFTDEDGNQPFENSDQRVPSSFFLVASQELLKAGQDYMAAISAAAQQ